MDKFTDKVLYSSHQHKIILLTNFLKSLLIINLPASIIIYFSTKNTAITATAFIILLILWFFYNYFFWKKSYFIITNQKVLLKVRNGFFSKFHMSIYYENIKDIAYSKNNVLHYMFNYWTFFARSSAWANWDFMATHLPKIEQVYKYVNYLYLMPKEERRNITSLNSSENQNNLENSINKQEKKLTKEEIIEAEKQKLLSIKWIKEVVLLEDKDRKYIFENEEDRNHWVYACISKKITFCITHNSEFRSADSPIVFKSWEKVIFPAVWFHEVWNSTTVSSSPGLKIHNYLSEKFNNMENNDATVLVWFDIQQF